MARPPESQSRVATSSTRSTGLNSGNSATPIASLMSPETSITLARYGIVASDETGCIRKCWLQTTEVKPACRASPTCSRCSAMRAPRSPSFS